MLKISTSCCKFDILEWSRKIDVAWTEDLYTFGIYAGVDMLEYLYRSNCPVPHHPERLCVEAVQAGRLDVLKWCISKGFPKSCQDHLVQIEW